MRKPGLHVSRTGDPDAKEPADQAGVPRRWDRCAAPSNFGRDWRTVRDDLGVPEVTTHSFCKTLATLIDDGCLSARVGADNLGHSKASMTQDVNMARGKTHIQVADLLDDATSCA
jgi:integrase